MGFAGFVSRSKCIALAVMCACLHLAGCSSTESFVMHVKRPAYPQGCAVRWFGVATPHPAGSLQVATAEYGDSGFSVACSPGKVRRSLHARACEVGANAIKIKEEAYPGAWSTCYRATADLLYFKDEAALSKGPGPCLLPSGALQPCAAEAAPATVSASQ